MIKEYSRYMFVMLLPVLAALTGCLTSKSCTDFYPQYAVETQSAPLNYNAFTQIRVDIAMTPTECYNSLLQEPCDDMLPHFPTIEVTSTGSGAVISHENGKTYVLTAAHVCWVEPYETVQNNTMILEILSISNINLVLYDGTVATGNVFYVDEERDVCLISTPGRLGQPLPIAENNPVQGQKYYNMAAPYGIFSPGMTLSFDGYYSGMDEGLHFYTIPARPGSSGSAVINSHGEIVGIITMASTVFETMSIVTSLSSIIDAENMIQADSDISNANTDWIIMRSPESPSE